LDLLGKVFILFFCEFVRNFLKKMLNVLIVGDVIGFLRKKGSNFKLFCICPSVDNLLTNLYKLPFFEFFFLLELDFGMNYIKEGLKFGKI
jgi:hypothetical protein